MTNPGGRGAGVSRLMLIPLSDIDRDRGEPWPADVAFRCPRARPSAHTNGVQAPSGELEHGFDLRARDGELIDDLVDAQAVFEIFEDHLHGRAVVLEQPGSADFVWDPLNGGTLRPVECGHGSVRVAQRWTLRRRVSGRWRPHRDSGADGVLQMLHQEFEGDVRSRAA